jgi:phage repressor protein C with HTH and peptisase S24 domain
MSRENNKSAERKRAAETSDRSAFAERLQRSVNHYGGVVQVAEAAGFSPSALRKWLSAKAEPSRERLITVARVCNVPIAWLIQGEGEPPDLAPVFPAADLQLHEGEIDLKRRGFVVLPRHAVETAAAGYRSDETARKSDLAFAGAWITNYLRADATTLKTVIAIGDSMAHLIGDGDILVIDTKDTAINAFGVYVLVAGDKVVVKRVQKNIDGKLILLNDNLLYQDEVIDPDTASKIKVLGKVIWRGGRI